MYESTGQDKNIIGFCHMFMEYMAIYIIRFFKQDVKFDYYKLDMYINRKIDYDYILRHKVATDFSGKYVKKLNFVKRITISWITRIQHVGIVWKLYAILYNSYILMNNGYI